MIESLSSINYEHHKKLVQAILNDRIPQKGFSTILFKPEPNNKIYIVYDIPFGAIT